MTNAIAELTGNCLCGAVQLRVTGHAAEVSACHCTLCRRWSGGVLLCLASESTQVHATGPVATYRSSDFAERAWCGECGSHLWIRDDDGGIDLMPGLFEGARDLPLVREIYADRAFASARLAGEHPRRTRAEYEAENSHVEEEP